MSFGKYHSLPLGIHGEKITALRSDRGEEYMSKEAKKFLKKKGIHHEETVAHCSPQNGVAERMNRTLCDSARTILFYAQLPN